MVISTLTSYTSSSGSPLYSRSIFRLTGILAIGRSVKNKLIRGRMMVVVNNDNVKWERKYRFLGGWPVNSSSREKISGGRAGSEVNSQHNDNNDHRGSQSSYS
jgi:hypothetical protein